MDNPISNFVDSENAQITVEVAFARPDQQLILKLMVSAGTTVRQAIDASGIRDEFPEIEAEPMVGLFSKKVTLDHELREGDRVEIYRPLIADPKESRRNKANLEKAARAGK